MAGTVLCVLALCFITIDIGGSGLRSAHRGVRGTLGALYRGTDTVLGPVRRFVEGVPTAGSNRSRIDQLQHEVAQLRGQVAAAEADHTRQGELAALQLAADSAGRRIVAGRVSALGSAEGFDWTATLDVGSDSGIAAGQTVTDGYGLVGRVLHADRSSCVVLLAADPGSGVGARDLRTGEVGLATGQGTTGFGFVPLDPTANVRVGDKLVTGPSQASSFVPGLAIGTIAAVRSSTDGSTTATVHPATSPSALDLVGVMLDGSSSTSSTSGAAGRSAQGRAPLQPSGAAGPTP